MRTRRGYDLFCTGDLAEVLRNYHAQAVHAVDELPEADFKRLSDRQVITEIRGSFNMKPLVLHEDAKAMERSETTIDVNDYGRTIRIKALRVVVSIPFDGDVGLWRLKPNAWTTTVPAGEVQPQDASGSGGTLQIALEVPADAEHEAIKRGLDRAFESLRFYVENQGRQLEGEEAQLVRRLDQAIAARRERLARHGGLADFLGIPEARPAMATEAPPVARKGSATRQAETDDAWDVFVSHASEDKDDFARPLAEALRASGLRVWYDEFSLKVGDSLRQSIERGLARSRYGVVIISPRFLEKHWPQRELDGLAARATGGQKVILPVWHNVDHAAVVNVAPMLADLMAVNSSKGIPTVVAALRDAMGMPTIIQTSPSGGKLAQDEGVKFQKGERWDGVRHVALFNAVVGDKTIGCAISLEALSDHFDADVKEPLSGFRANRDKVEALAAKFIAGRRFEPDGSILIRTADV
jgi:hypothetical protein